MQFRYRYGSLVMLVACFSNQSFYLKHLNRLIFIKLILVIMWVYICIWHIQIVWMFVFNPLNSMEKLVIRKSLFMFCIFFRFVLPVRPNFHFSISLANDLNINQTYKIYCCFIYQSNTRLVNHTIYILH